MTAAVALAAIVTFLVIGATSGSLPWRTLLGSSLWDPPREHFGASAMIWGTAAVAVLALCLAAPVGWGTAIAIHEIVPRRLGRVLRSGAEILAVIPSIVYGLLGLAYLRPFVARVAHVPGGDSLLAAGIVLGVMVLPTIVAVSLDALAGIPASTREAAAACGLTRTEVIRDAVLPQARRGFRAAVLLALARALGETVAVFLVIGRADGRIPRSATDLFNRLVRPGQTLTTKLNGPESVLAGTSGPQWAALCGLGLILLVAVVGFTIAGQRGATTPAGLPHTRKLRPHWRGASSARRLRDRLAQATLLGVVALPLAAAVTIVAVVASKGSAAFNPRFWWSASVGANGGGIRTQLTGTALVVVLAGLIAAPVGLGLGLVMTEYARPALGRWVRTLTLTLGGVPSIVLGLFGYWLFVIRLGLGKSWLTGAIVLALVAIPPVAVAVGSAAAALPGGRREAALAVGLRHHQFVWSVLIPQAIPGLVTGLLLGLARAAGETAPLLFTATVFNGAESFPTGIRDSPIAALPTHIFVLAQDSAQAGAVRSAWGAALALVIVAGLLVAAAIPVRHRMERTTR